MVKVGPITPLSDPELNSRTLKITKNTVIKERVEKSKEQYKKEVKEFRESKENVEDDGVYPLPFVFKEVAFSSLQEGQRIKAESINGTHIGKKKEFNVSEIVIKREINISLSIE